MAPTNSTQTHMKTQRLFALDPQTLRALRSVALLADGELPQPQVSLTDTNVVAADASSSLPRPPALACMQTCAVRSFASVEEMRRHFKSDWHRYNTQRRLRSLPLVAADAFEALSEVSSIDASSDGGSDSDKQSDDDKDDDGDGDAHASSSGLLTLKGSPFVKLLVHSIAPGSESTQTSLHHTDAPSPEQMLVYKLTLAPKSLSDDLAKSTAFWVQQIMACQPASGASSKEEPLWTLIMIGSGHFAGLVIGCRSGKVIAHKTFHRYTTRRKQGGAQSNNDSSKGNAKSAGAGLRRYNEAALQAEIQALMVSWKPNLDASSAIFVRAAGASSRAAVFFDNDVLVASDPRVRTFPFTTRRPTLAELTRCYEELVIVRFQEVEHMPVQPLEKSVAEMQLQSETEMDATSNKDAVPSATKQDSQTAPSGPPPPSGRLVKLIDFCRRGKLELLKAQLEPSRISSLDVNASPESVREAVAALINTPLPDTDGTSLLHIASSCGQAETVRVLLELGADPTLRGQSRPARAYDVAQAKDVRDAFRRFMAAAPDAWDYASAHVPGPLTLEMEERQREKEREQERRRKEAEDRKRTKSASAVKSAFGDLDDEDLLEAQASSSSSKGSTSRLLDAVINAARPGSLSSSLKSSAPPITGKRLASAKLSKQQLESVGMTPEQRARLDREKRALAAEARMRTQQNKCGACNKSLSGITPFSKQQFRYCSPVCLEKHRILF